MVPVHTLACAWLLTSAASFAVFELNAESFYAAISADEDALIAFSGNEHSAADVDTSSHMLDELASRLGPASGIRVCTYDVRSLGLPSGLHVHSLPAVILFPVGREPIAYVDEIHEHGHRHSHEVDSPQESGTCGNSAHSSNILQQNRGAHTGAVKHVCEHDHEDLSDTDELRHGSSCGLSSSRGHASNCIGHDHHEHSHAQEHDHDHEHGHDHGTGASDATVPSLLRFLRRHSTAPALVPVPTLADDFSGRDVLRALENGIDVVRSQMAALRAENEALRAQLQRCMRASTRAAK